MGHDLNAQDGNAPEGALPVSEPEAESTWDINTIGYEAAHPSLHAFWDEALAATPSARNLR